MPEWEKRIHLLCAIEEDDRERKRTWEGLEFIAKLLVGGGDEPTKEKPIKESSVINGKTEVRTRKVVDFNHEERVAQLAEQSKSIMAEAGPILEKLRQEMQAKAQQTS